jgi:hypothetical protein
MARESEKARKEREAFQLFAERLGVRHKWLSIESRKPDEPDLLGVHMEHGQIAFELVRICDPNIAEVRADGHKAHQAAFSTADPSERIIREKLKKTYVTPHPVELLIYSEGVVITPDDVIAPTILPWFDAIRHSFRKVWLMGKKEAGCLWAAS